MTSTQPPPSQSGQIKVMDLFAGAGGFSAGFATYASATGENPFSSVAAVEFDAAAASTYAANFGGAHVYPGDIAQFDPTPFKGQVDVIMGGPPCQGFSGLGKEDPGDPRNELWQEYVRVVSRVHPKLFVIENVDRFLKSPQYRDLCAASETPGHPLHDYTVIPAVLNAADYGVPQARKRVIVICTHKDFRTPLRHPEATHDKNGFEPETADAPQAALFGPKGDALRKPRWVSVEDIFKRSEKLPINTGLPEPRKGENPLTRGVPGHYLTTDLHFGRNPVELSRARYAAIPPGGNRKNLQGMYYRLNGKNEIVLSTDPAYRRLKSPEHYLSTLSWDKHTSGSGDVMGRLRVNAPSVTIRTEFYKPEKGRYLHPREPRPITHYEAALIQGFPEAFKWFGTKTDIARQIGNAVPVGLSRVLAESIHRFLATEG